MQTLYLDYETRCALDLRKVGPYRYVSDESFGIILVSYAVNTGPVRTLFLGDDLRGFIDALADADRLVAHNVQFERLVTRTFQEDGDQSRWSCTSARARVAGLPGSLDGAAAALGFKSGKDKRGKQLIRLYSMPQKDGTFRELDDQARTDWTLYSRRDVELLRALDIALPELPEYEKQLFIYDMVLNDRGICIDRELLESCLGVIALTEGTLNSEIAELTNDKVLTSTQCARMLAFINNEGCETSDLSKQTVQELLKQPELKPVIRRVLELRSDGARTSVGKLDAMDRREVDGRLHGMLLYYGAHTGRHSSVGVQLQNLPRPERPWWMIAEGISDLPNTDIQTLRLLYGSPIGLVADTLRSLLIPEPGNVFEIADLHAVELRGAAWIAGEDWILTSLQADIDIYAATASALFNRTISKEDERERFLGKTLELAGQYGMGWARFQKTCAMHQIDVSDHEAERSVNTYREMHPAITKQWRAMDVAACSAVSNPGSTYWATPIAFRVERDWLLMKLPSNRCLHYFEPCFSEDGLSYRGVNPVTHQFERQRLWGSLLFQHATQALCRDILMEGCKRLETHGHPVRLLVHDETVSEMPIEKANIQLVEDLLSTSPWFAKDLPLKAKGKVVERYRKI